MSDTFYRAKTELIIVSVLFLILTILHFASAPIPCTLALPVGLLFMASLKLLPWQMSLAMLFSCAGDYFGACGTFIEQMAAFALAHIFIISYFFSRYRLGLLRRKYGRLTLPSLITATVVTIPILTFAVGRIIPSTPDGIIRYGTSFYSILIAFMLWCALQQRSILFALGASLFLASDMVIAWNRFIEPVPYSRYFVLVPYYLAQWLLFIRSTKWWGRQMAQE